MNLNLIFIVINFYQIFTIGYNEGYLHKNFKGQWYPVCTVVKSWTKDACISEIGHDIRYDRISFIKTKFLLTS